MRFQRSISRLLDRWSDQVDPFGHELRDIAPIAVPAFLVGEDRVDLERPVYAGYPFSPAVVGEVSAVAIEAGTRTVELLSCVVTVAVADRVGLRNQSDLGTTFLGSLTPPTARFQTDERNIPFVLSGTLGGSGTRNLRGGAAWGSAAGLQVAAFSPVELVNRGPIFLPPGYRMQVGLHGVNIGVSAAFLWRELAA